MPCLVVILSGPSGPVVAEAGAGPERRLSAAEAERMGRLRRPADRQDFLAAHLLARACAARLLGLDPGEVSIVQRCTTCGGPHGRPEIAGHPGLGLSLAHSRGVVAAAAGTAPVGVDIEAFPPDAGLTPGDLAAALTAGERAAIGAAGDGRRALLLAWTRKEACLKAGLVDVDGLAAFDLSALPLDPPAGDLVVRSQPWGRWAVHDWWDGRAGAIGAAVAPAGARVALAGT